MMTIGNLEVGPVSVFTVIIEMQDFENGSQIEKCLPLLHICRFSRSVCAVALRY